MLVVIHLLSELCVYIGSKKSVLKLNDTCDGVLQFVQRQTQISCSFFCLFYFKRCCQYSLQTFQLPSKKMLKFWTLVVNVT